MTTTNVRNAAEARKLTGTIISAAKELELDSVLEEITIAASEGQYRIETYLFKETRDALVNMQFTIEATVIGNTEYPQQCGYSIIWYLL